MATPVHLNPCGGGAMIFHPGALFYPQKLHESEIIWTERGGEGEKMASASLAIVSLGFSNISGKYAWKNVENRLCTRCPQGLSFPRHTVIYSA